MPTSSSIIRMGWPKVCPQQFCLDKELPGHHHHGGYMVVEAEPCQCSSMLLWLPGTRPQVKKTVVPQLVKVTPEGIKLLILSILDEDYQETGGKRPTQSTERIMAVVAPYLRRDERGHLVEAEDYAEERERTHRVDYSG